MSRRHSDLSQPSQIANTIMALMPDVVVDAAAHTAVDKAEIDTELAYLVNGLQIKDQLQQEIKTP